MKAKEKKHRSQRPNCSKAVPISSSDSLHGTYRQRSWIFWIKRRINHGCSFGAEGTVTACFVCRLARQQPFGSRSRGTHLHGLSTFRSATSFVGPANSMWLVLPALLCTYSTWHAYSRQSDYCGGVGMAPTDTHTAISSSLTIFTSLLYTLQALMTSDSHDCTEQAKVKHNFL